MVQPVPRELDKLIARGYGLCVDRYRPASFVKQIHDRTITLTTVQGYIQNNTTGMLTPRQSP